MKQPKKRYVDTTYFVSSKHHFHFIFVIRHVPRIFEILISGHRKKSYFCKVIKTRKKNEKFSRYVAIFTTTFHKNSNGQIVSRHISFRPFIEKNLSSKFSRLAKLLSYFKNPVTFQVENIKAIFELRWFFQSDKIFHKSNAYLKHLSLFSQTRLEMSSPLLDTDHIVDILQLLHTLVEHIISNRLLFTRHYKLHDCEQCRNIVTILIETITTTTAHLRRNTESDRDTRRCWRTYVRVRPTISNRKMQRLWVSSRSICIVYGMTLKSISASLFHYCDFEIFMI